MVVERRKCKKRKDEGYERLVNSEKPSKDEYAVAKWIRSNVPSKKTKFDRIHTVEYFTGTRVVDALVDRSPWKNTLFESRQEVVDFLETMLRHKFFHRAKKIVITENELHRIKNSKKKNNKVMSDLKETNQEHKNDKALDSLMDCKDKEQKYCSEEDHEEIKKECKKKSKVRLEMHMEQYFEDCHDAYVWIYEPIPLYYWFFGALLVLAAIGVCLFPLWPLTVRHGVWYLSIAAAGFLVFILSLIIIRLIIFCFLWVLTFGKHHLWLLPNLVEDVGFFASFWPLYHYKYYGDDETSIYLKKKNQENQKISFHTNVDEKSKSERSKSSVSTKNFKTENTKTELDSYKTSEEESGSEKSNIGDFELL